LKSQLIKSLKLEVTPWQYMLAADFADKTHMLRYEKYKERNPHLTPTKCWHDIVSGTISEFVAKNILQFSNFNITDVNLEVLDAFDKSFDPDLLERNKGYRFHVKGVEATHYTPSHLFENNDPLVTNPEHNDYIISVSWFTDPQGICAGWINGCFKASDIKKYNLYEDPIKEDLKGKKKAIYLKNIENILTEYEFWTILLERQQKDKLAK
tara:strand:- start:2776 stop:3405 length:630 start_codon:yes stop_codon:yes gene_type:complete